jgi:hypothetical protein
MQETSLYSDRVSTEKSPGTCKKIPLILHEIVFCFDIGLTVFFKTGLCRYGYVTPDDVPLLFRQHIIKGEIFDSLWR